MKTLLLLRHSEADNSALNFSDHERPLSEQGKQDSNLAKEWIIKAGFKVDNIFVSSASRTKSTAELIFPAYKKLLKIKPELYLCSKIELINCLQKAEDTAETIAIVGHEPSMSESLNELVGSFRPDLKDIMHGEYPTTGISVIVFNTNSWKNIFPRDGTLDAFNSPDRTEE